MGTEFTRGPWRVRVCDDGDVDVVADSEHGVLFVAEPVSSSVAALISAAPDLYAVVEAAVEALGALDPSSLRLWEANLLVVARAAVAKARGES